MLMDGVTIIDSNIVVAESMLNFMVAYACFLFIMIACICMGIWRWRVDKIPLKRAKAWIWIGLIGGIIIGCLIGKFVLPKTTDYKTIFKVQIEDNVTIGDITEDYIILEQDGNYFYLEEIEDENNK